MQEVSRVRSTVRNPALQEPYGKERIHKKKLNPWYVSGFIDGEGSFSVGIGVHKTLKRGIEIRCQFEIELRADDRDILDRICVTLGCGKIYDCSYERYGWYPHLKYKIGSTKEMAKYLFPFLDRYPLQAKKRESYILFKKAVFLFLKKEHLSQKGYKKVLALRKEIQIQGKKHLMETARVRENRLPSGVWLNKENIRP